MTKVSATGLPIRTGVATNSLRYCDWYGNMHRDLGAVGSIPYRSEFKLQGNVPLWYKFEFSASLCSDPVYNTNFALNNVTSGFPSTPNIEPTFGGCATGIQRGLLDVDFEHQVSGQLQLPSPGAVVDSGLAQGSETIVLVPPGSRLTPQLTQFDIAIRRGFVVHERYNLKAEAQIFNVLNSNVVTAEAQTLGSSVTPFLKGGIGGVPSAILSPRMLRLAVQFRF